MQKQLKNIYNEEILKIIKKILLERHPIINNRLDMLLTNPYPIFEIMIHYIKENNEEITVISFMDGTSTYRKTIQDSLEIYGLISNELLYLLISYILNDHDYIKSVQKTSREINISFGVDLKNEKLKGISCGEINLSIEVLGYPDDYLINDIFTFIFSNFFTYFQHTEFYKKEYANYSEQLKKRIINSFSEVDLYQILRLLDSKTLKELLLKLSLEEISSLQEEYQNKLTRKKLE